jgi:hypothetical protein
VVVCGPPALGGSAVAVDAAVASARMA